jgi:membrane-associated phospholipid phosphatase
MRTNHLSACSLWHCALLAVVVVYSSSVCAQIPTPTPTATPPASQPSPTPSLERRFIKNILHDQFEIFTSPLHIRKDDTYWLLPLGLATGTLIATDPNTARALNYNQSRLNLSRDISYVGSGYGAGGIVAAFYVFGWVEHNARARETGLLGAEALIDSGIVAQVLKAASRRPRPLSDQDRNGDFFEGGSSFPSGHATAAWSVAAVVACEYKDHPLVRFGAYGLAAAVSAARYTGQNHFLSDVLVGSAIGYGIGHYVCRTYHDQSLDADSRIKTRSRLFPAAAPRYNARARGYGLTLAWTF